MEGQKVEKPLGTGLFIRGEEISAPDDALIVSDW